jgi:predicted transposase/invertase (TIGR01784 family)
MKAKYLNPFTDYGFKRIFGEEASKPILISFLNSVLPPENQIKTLSFKNAEQLGQTELDRKSIFDIYCENENGEKFIVELQKAKQNYFKDRTVYYSTFPIKEQAEKGEWNYKLKAVFCIGILDFCFTDYKDDELDRKNEVVHTVKLKDQNNKVFYNKLTFVYLELPNFKKKEAELKSDLDKWIYFLKNLEDFENIPEIFKGKVEFEQAFETAALGKLNIEEYNNYELSLKVYRDNKNTFDYAIEQAELTGWNRGIQKGKLEIAIQLLDILDDETISLKTGLKIDEVRNLRKKAL